MKLHSDSFPNNGVIPAEFAFAQIDEKVRVRFANNKNPHLIWSEVPEGTQSFVVLCIDDCAPTDGTDVNQPDREVPADLPRADFFHWILINIPADMREITAGQFSNEVTPRGKAGPVVPTKELVETPLRHGINDYTYWFANDHDMQGDYYGYDGPCPPWNDSIVHKYTFTVYALDIPELKMPLASKLNISSVKRRMENHILDTASWTGVYTLTPRLAAGLAIDGGVGGIGDGSNNPSEAE